MCNKPLDFNLLRLRSAALEATANSVIITDRSGTIVWANAAFTRSTGYTFEEAVGQNPSLLKSGLHDNAFYRNLWKTVLSGQPWQGELVNRHKDGKCYPQETTITPIRDEYGEITHFVGVKQDLTERKRAAQALQQSEARHQFLFEHMLDGLAYCRMYFKDGEPLDFEYLEVNASFEKMTGLKQLVGKKVSDVIPGIQQSEPELFKIYGRVVITGKPERFERHFKALNLWFYISVFSCGDDCFAAVFDNITERRQLETQLRQAQKMEAIGQLAGGVAHDFNNMLSVIRGNAELILMDEAHLSAEVHDALREVTAAAERATNLTRQLLTFSRKQTIQLANLNLNEVITNLAKMLRRILKEDIQMECVLAKEQCFVRADVGMMEQVLLNLVVNARDAMENGGDLRIETERTVLDGPHARMNSEARAGEFIRLSVSDTGTGIAPEHLPQIFVPFFTTKDASKGTGLGLATVHGIVKQHQGWIEVDTALGAGASFKIYLPSIGKQAAAAVEKTRPAPRGGTEKILLVEDDKAVRSLTRRVLESFGYQVWEAAVGHEAIEIWDQHRQEIDLLLTDMVMPGGMTGLDLAQRLQRQKPGLKVIITSGYNLEESQEVSQAQAVVHFLQKPSSSRSIVEMVRHSLDTPQH